MDNNKKNNLKHFKKTFIGIVILLAMTLPRHMGFTIYVFLIFLIPMSIYSLFVMYKNKNQREVRGIKLLLWSLAISISIGYNFYIHTSTRTEANKIVAKVENYKSSKGEYPKNIELVGITNKTLKDKLGSFSYYSNDKGNISLTYGITYIIFDTYAYNFKNKSWQTYN